MHACFHGQRHVLIALWTRTNTPRRCIGHGDYGKLIGDEPSGENPTATRTEQHTQLWEEGVVEAHLVGHLERPSLAVEEEVEAAVVEEEGPPRRSLTA